MNSKELGIQAWTDFLVAGLALLSLGTLATTFEVSPGFFLAPLIGFLLARLSRRRLSSRWISGISIAALIGGLAASLGNRVSVLEVASILLPVLHGLIWLNENRRSVATWSLLLGVGEILLAAGLSSELYAALSTLLFFLLGTVTISCLFLETALSEPGNQTLPKTFISKSIGSSLWIIVITALLYPILPRTNDARSLGVPTLPFGKTQTGYTEEVNLEAEKEVSGIGEGVTALRLFSPPSTELMLEIPLGLLRSRVLDTFENDHWRASVRTVKRALSAPQGIAVEIIREPLSSSVLPAPYGTLSIDRIEPTGDFKPVRSESGEWLLRGSEGNRVRYTAWIPADPEKSRTRDLTAPTPAEREVPPALYTSRLKMLERQLLAKLSRPTDKARAISTFFTQSGFKTDSLSGDLQGASRVLERFLFETRSGHCELYASATALLLRLSGVPTRLVSGFRVSRSPRAGVLTIRTGDAHAWLEYWTSDRGWLPLDPTPRTVLPRSWWETAKDSYEILSAYWFKYFLSFRASWSDLSGLQIDEANAAPLTSLRERALAFLWRNKAQLLYGLLLVSGLATLIYLLLRTYFPTLFSIEWRVRESPYRPLRQERRRYERALQRGEARDDPAWHELYGRLRFGPVSAREREEGVKLLRSMSGKNSKP